jgi:antirestriction protein ArdC
MPIPPTRQGRLDARKFSGFGWPRQKPISFTEGVLGCQSAFKFDPAWGTAAIKAPLAMPRNASTQRGYSGINVLILWGSVIEHGFSGQSWLTFRQALGVGGHVRKGERGTTVVYADRFTPDDERRRAAEAGEEPGAIPFLKRFTVFNTDQCDGLPEGVAASVVPPPPDQIEPRAEALIAATGADFRIGGARAYYNTSNDFVQVPPPAAYFEPINWHRTAFHELGHNAEPSVMPRRSGFARKRDQTDVAMRHNQSEKWFEENDPEGVAFEYEVLE